ncbi:alpha/beta fold hydrolase [Jejudonia soesokkakensis]|uniref:Alpha/beta fold hydrolase n=1 Tax=Jejudonia soesokkakensis TaxID=1323432 RepID=A0ABW2MV48_9FLAO
MKKLIIYILRIFIRTTAVLFPKWNAAFLFWLLCKVKKAPITQKGHEFFAQGEQEFFEVDGQSTVLHRWGNGSKNLLFLHGWMSNSQRWLPYFEKLDLSQYTMYALDAPGHGLAKGTSLNIETYRQAVEKSIAAIGKIDTVVSHSLGTTVITYLYLYNPKIPIDKFIIMGAPSGMDAIFKYFQDLCSLSNKASQNLDNKINTVLKIPHQNIHIKNFLSAVKKPVLVIHDVNDDITPVSPIIDATKDISEIKSLFTKGLKHDLKSEQVYTCVLNFVAEKELELAYC